MAPPALSAPSPPPCHTPALRDAERRITGSDGTSVPSGTYAGFRVVTHAVLVSDVAGRLGDRSGGLQPPRAGAARREHDPETAIAGHHGALRPTRQPGRGRDPSDAIPLAWAAVLVIALACFLPGRRPVHTNQQQRRRLAAVIASVLAVAAVGVCVRPYRRRTSSTAAALLGAGRHRFRRGGGADQNRSQPARPPSRGLVFGWQVYALIVVGATGMLLDQWPTGPARCPPACPL